MIKILVCHTGAWIGDMVLLTPTLRALKDRFTESHLTIFLRPHVADLMKANPYVDNCMVDMKNDGFFSSIIELSKIIRNEKYDIAVVLHPTSYRNALLPLLARIPIRVGLNHKGRGFLFTDSCSIDPKSHEVERYFSVLTLLKNAYISDSSENIPLSLEYWHTNAERNSVRKLLLKEGVTNVDRIIAVNIGTTWQTKQWNIENFATLISEVSNIIPEIKIIITGSKSEHHLTENLPTTESVVNLVGKVNILQLGALLERSEVCLTCDSGPMHIAASVGTPCVALFGPTDPVRHQPYGNGHEIIEKQISCRPCYKRKCYRSDIPNLCMKDIKTSEVIEKIAKIIKSTRKK